ncbi:MAG: hypothetical protein HYV16_08880 [Gammaproteobacteria bacterium]|nr:hypothetical protein [Gammaproteobacteria bacterium]
MDKQEALDRLKLIETMVSEQRGSAIENGRGLMGFGLAGGLLLFLGYAVKLDSLPEPGHWMFVALGLVLMLLACVFEWRRYRRFRPNPTLAYRVYLSFTLGSVFFLVPVTVLEQRGQLSSEAALSLLFALMALSFAIYRPILGNRWLDGAALVWFAGACLSAAGMRVDPLLLGGSLMLLGMALPGWLMVRQSRNAAR